MANRNGPRDFDTILSCRYWLTDAGYDVLDADDTDAPLATQAAMLSAVSATVGGPSGGDR